MIQRMLMAILSGLTALHEENKAIARELGAGGDAGKMWDELFYGKINSALGEAEAAEEGDSDVGKDAKRDTAESESV